MDIGEKRGGMNNKEIFEKTMTEPVEESGMVLRKHIADLLKPFAEIGQIEWAMDEIECACDHAFEPFRPALHTDECLNNRPDKGHWHCTCIPEIL